MKRNLFISLLFLPFFLNAQNTTYFMDRLPQKLSFNPAFVPEVDFYLTLPVIGGIKGNFYNSGFNYNELNQFINNISNPGYNPDNFVKSIGDYNNFITELQVNILSFGFKTKKEGYFSFNITGNNISNFRTSSEIVYLLADLNDIQDEDFPIKIDDMELNTSSYMTYEFSFSKKINENLIVGISPKLNFNQLGIQTKNIGFIVELEKTEYDKEYNQYIKGEVLLGMPVEINPEALNGNELDLNQGLFPNNWPKNASFSDFFKNSSFTLDLGAAYTLDDWTFSASILNIGASTWKKNAYRLYGNNETIFIEETEKIHARIPVIIYLGANRWFSPSWNYGLVFNNIFLKSGSIPTATLSLNGYVGKMLSTSVSYTAGYKFDNVGFGIRLRFLPGTDMFMVTDNIIQAFNFKNANRFTLAMGLNFTFGISDKPKIDNM